MKTNERRTIERDTFKKEMLWNVGKFCVYGWVCVCVWDNVLVCFCMLLGERYTLSENSNAVDVKRSVAIYLKWIGLNLKKNNWKIIIQKYIIIEYGLWLHYAAKFGSFNIASIILTAKGSILSG